MSKILRDLGPLLGPLVFLGGSALALVLAAILVAALSSCHRVNPQLQACASRCAHAGQVFSALTVAPTDGRRVRWVCSCKDGD